MIAPPSAMSSQSVSWQPSAPDFLGLHIRTHPPRPHTRLPQSHSPSHAQVAAPSRLGLSLNTRAVAITVGARERAITPHDRWCATQVSRLDDAGRSIVGIGRIVQTPDEPKAGDQNTYISHKKVSKLKIHGRLVTCVSVIYLRFNILLWGPTQ